MRDVLTPLYQTKLTLTRLTMVITGALLMVVDAQLTIPTWAAALPWAELGSILIGAGLLSVWLDHFLGREQDALDEQRLRRLLTEHAPVMRDAVLDAFAANHEDLARIATPGMLDDVITNSLALRLRDQQFATEIYTDIRDQAISAAERWHDATLSVSLDPITPTGTRKRSTQDRFSVTVRWEYTTIPVHAQRRFACVSDRDEYNDLLTDRANTSAWYINPASGIDPAHPDSFQLLRFTINGDERPIRRTQNKTGQTYTASIGTDHIHAGQPVTVAYTYRTQMNRPGTFL